ncbi:MAG: restriction endonuclease subunit S [Bacteroidia bacterium]|nr:restriction endonuclease subunit S [Bacteroidia bacterium]
MKYEQYSPSTIRWNHEYPTHWSCEKAKRFFANPKKLNKGNEESNVLSLTLRGVIRNNGEKPIGLSPSDYSTYQIFNSGELVFKLIDLNNISTSRVGMVPEKGIMSSAYIRFVPRAEMNIKYFYYQYYDWYKRNIFNGLGEGVRQTLSGNDLRNLEILIPPRDEQDQIARYLDWQVSKINKLIAAKKKQIALLHEREQQIVANTITHGIDNDAETIDSGVDWIGYIPSHWQVMRCKYLFRERDERSVDGNETHLSMSQKYGLVPDTQLDERRMLSASYAGGKLCYENDLVLNRLKAHLGVFALAPQHGVISPDYTVLIPNTEIILPSFGEAVLKSSKCRSELRIRVRGIIEGFWRLYTDDFYTIKLPIPSLYEQAAIMQYLAVQHKNTKTYEESIRNEIDTLHELRTCLISDVVTGQIDVRGIEVPDFDMVEETDIDEENLDDEDAAEETEEQEVE